jgi:hypothetical protein
MLVLGNRETAETADLNSVRTFEGAVRTQK